jgi:hypothetical protein
MKTENVNTGEYCEEQYKVELKNELDIPDTDSLITKCSISNGNRQNIELREPTTVVVGDGRTEIDVKNELDIPDTDSLITKCSISNGNRQNIELREPTTVVVGDGTTRSSAAVQRVNNTHMDFIISSLPRSNHDELIIPTLAATAANDEIRQLLLWLEPILVSWAGGDGSNYCSAYKSKELRILYNRAVRAYNRMHLKMDQGNNKVLRRDLISIHYFDDVLRAAFLEDAFLYKRLNKVGVYYSGEKGLHMNKYGPVVKIGPKPYPLTPCAHSFYESQIEGKGEKYYLQEGVKLPELRVYNAAMGLFKESVKCFLLTMGFIVRLDEYYLLKTHISQYCKSLLRLMMMETQSVRGGALKKMKIVSSSRRDVADIAIRSLWPGNTHRVFAKPAGSIIMTHQTEQEQQQEFNTNKNSGYIIEFHKVRLMHVQSYLQKVWKEVSHDIVAESGGSLNASVLPSYDTFAKNKFLERRLGSMLDAEKTAVAIDLGASKVWFKQWYKRNRNKRLNR